MDIRKVKKYSSIFSIDEKGIDGKKMNNSWVLCGIGILFCCSGVILFFKKVYEDGQSLKWPVIILILGVMLIVAGTAKFFKLLN
jgi:uncharacterized membrane protein YidH (DUF202 family)